MTSPTRSVSLKLYRFPYSPYAWKVQALLELAHLPFEVVDVPFCDRTEFLRVSGGSMHVPVLVRNDRAVVGSREICKVLVAEEPRVASLVPSPWEGPLWAYADWVESELEDAAFRLAAPGVRSRFATENERAFFTLIKDRKFGAGAVDDWATRAAELSAEVHELLTPTARTLAQQPFVFGSQPTLADTALYGQLAMLDYAANGELPALGNTLTTWYVRMHEHGVSRPK